MTDETLKRHPAPWRVVEAGGAVVNSISATYKAEDDCIVDANGAEVIGTSEWLRGGENLAFIVDCVNIVAGDEGILADMARKAQSLAEDEARAEADAAVEPMEEDEDAEQYDIDVTWQRVYRSALEARGFDPGPLVPIPKPETPEEFAEREALDIARAEAIRQARRPFCDHDWPLPVSSMEPQNCRKCGGGRNGAPDIPPA